MTLGLETGLGFMFKLVLGFRPRPELGFRPGLALASVLGLMLDRLGQDAEGSLGLESGSFPGGATQTGPDTLEPC